MIAAHSVAPLRYLSAGALLATNYPIREFAIDPWLRVGESALLWAPTGLGKTWLTLSLAVAMAGRGRVWQWEAPKARRVLLVDGEMNAQDLQERLKFLTESRAVGGADSKALGENLILVSRQNQDPRAEFHDVTNRDHQERILSYMEKHEIDVVIIDNLTTCADGLSDENDAVAFKTVMSFLMKMKAAGKTAILVHHANKAGTAARGSSALEATFEVILGLQPIKLAKAGEATFITVFGKFRAKGNDSLTPRRWTLTNDGWTVADDEESNGGKILHALRSLDFISRAEICAALGISAPTVSRTIRKLIASGQMKEGEEIGLFSKARQLRREDAAPFDDLDETAENQGNTEENDSEEF
ncbi:AAA family ATPase [Sinorhizobium medicae]|nr:AAA family ATPase [Sinorhizobium medicae]